MNKRLLQPEIQDFINESLTANFSKLALQKNPFPEVPWSDILTQLGCKIKAKDKLPTWFECENILYPSKISLEQTSSEITAKYKAGLVEGKTLIDLTGGFGVDDYYFAKKINRVVHCELKHELSTIVSHNLEALKISNIECIDKDSSIVLKELNQQFDWIYIDPSRRNDAKGKVFMLKDCLPNVPENLDFYFSFSNNILIKTAPILDISAGLSELKNVKEIHIVAVNNEVKELLWVIEKGFDNDTIIKTINFNKETEEKFDFNLNQLPENNTYSLPQTYLYEPNSAILKSGAFDLIPSKFNLEKLHQHSHLYTSDHLINFTGRRFEIKNCFEYNKKEMKQFLENSKANITTRNFPETVDYIRKKWKIKDGGDVYTFFTTDMNNNKIVLICDKI
ncbi:MAG: class I SAM-dependent methyltransferase [Bacteroidota bacterium]